MDASTDEIRRQLAVIRDRDHVLATALEAGLSETDIAELTGMSRLMVADHIRRARAAAASEDAVRAARAARAVEDLWQLGLVVQDRWGLRWRGDSFGTDGRGWRCMSVGLRMRIGHARMAERGPLSTVRVDRVLAGPEATAARQAGEAEDAAVVVDGDAAETGDGLPQT